MKTLQQYDVLPGPHPGFVKKFFVSFRLVLNVVTGSLLIVYLSYAFGKDTYIHFLLVSMASLPFVLFRRKDRVRLVLAFIVPVALFLFVELGPEVDVLRVFLSENEKFIIKVLTGLVALGIQSRAMVKLYSSNEREIRSKEEIYKQYIQASKLAALGEMAGGVAHEINNPLTALILTSERMKRGAERNTLDRALVDDSLDKFVANIRRISNIVSGLREISRDSSLEPFEKVDVTEVISGAVRITQERFRERGVNLTWERAPEGTYVMGRQSQLSQILLTLLNNAFDAATETEEKWIHLQCAVKDDQIVLNIVDSGKGIKPEIAEKIFQPFFSTKPVGKGIGLNLSVAKSIIEEHKGVLRINGSRPRTTFELSIPRA